MNRTIIPALAAAALVVAVGPGSVDARTLKKNPVPAVRETGPAVSCVPLAQLRDSHVRDDRTIDFMRDRKRGWRNVLPQECPGLKSADTFSYETSLSQLCSVDIIHVLNQYGGSYQRGAACGLGKFQPIELVK